MTTPHFRLKRDLRILPATVTAARAATPNAAAGHAMAADGVLRNPPIGPHSGSRFVVLDDANRVTALTSLGIPHVVAQVVDYEDEELILDTWYHLVSNLPREIFMRYRPAAAFRWRPVI
jgi:hypothetical protein